MNDFHSNQSFPTSDVKTLIHRAKEHPLGLDFLTNGDLCSVAITFETHAFIVEKARAKLLGEKWQKRIQKKQ